MLFCFVSSSSSETNSFFIIYCALGRPGTALVSPYEFEVVAWGSIYPKGKQPTSTLVNMFSYGILSIRGLKDREKIPNQTVGEQKVEKKRLKNTVLFQMKKVFQEGDAHQKATDQ